MPDPSSRIIQARVVKAHAKRALNEISLSVGDELLVFDATNASMWFGQLIPRGEKKREVDSKGIAGNMDLPTGWFPAGNCVPIGAPPLPAHPSNTSSKGGVRLSMRIDASTFRNQLTAALGDPGIIVGTPIPGVPSPRLRKHARALHDYAAESPSELSIKAGDIISLLSSSEDDSWWEGESQAGLIGYFPKDFVQVFRDPSAAPAPNSSTTTSKALDYSEFDDPHALAIIAQVVTAHEPVVATNDSGTPFLPLAEGSIVALLDSNPNHMYWLAVHFNNNMAPLRTSEEEGANNEKNAVPPSNASPAAKSARVGLVPKANLAVFEGLAEPTSNYPFVPVPLSIMRVLANRANGSVQASDGQPACLARIAFEFFGENENEFEYLGVGDLVWVIDEDEAIKNEAWVEVESDTRRGFCPTSFIEILSDRVQAPKPKPNDDGDVPSTHQATQQSSQQRNPSSFSSSGPNVVEHQVHDVPPFNNDSNSPSSANGTGDNDDASDDADNSGEQNSGENDLPSPAHSTSSLGPPPTSGLPLPPGTQNDGVAGSPAASDALSRIQNLSSSSSLGSQSNGSISAATSGSAKKGKKKTKDGASSAVSVGAGGNATSDSNSGAPIGPHSTSSATLARALYPYTAESNSELSLNVGDIIRLIDYPANEEWWEGILLAADGSELPEEYIGFFPRDFVVILANPNREKKKKRPKRGASVSKKKKLARNATTNANNNVSADSDSGEAHGMAGGAAVKASYTSEIQALQTQVETMAMDVEMRQAELDASNAELSFVQLELAREKETTENQATEIATLNAALEELKSSYAALEARQKSVVANVSSKAELVQEERDVLKNDVAKWKSRAEASEAQVSALQSQVSSLQSQVTQLSQQSNASGAQNASNHHGPPASAPPAAPHAASQTQQASSQAPPLNSSASSAGPPPSSALPSTPKGRQLPPTPATPGAGGAPPKLASQPKLSQSPSTPASGAPKRSMPPSQPAPSLPAEFVKKTAAPTSGIRAASHISAQSVAAGAKKAASAKRASGVQAAPHHQTIQQGANSGSRPGSVKMTGNASGSQPNSPAHHNVTSSPASTLSGSHAKQTGAGSQKMSSYTKPGAAGASNSGATQPPPKVLDEFENKRRFFESLK